MHLATICLFETSESASLSLPADYIQVFVESLLTLAPASKLTHFTATIANPATRADSRYIPPGCLSLAPFKLGKITHLLITIDHLNPSAAFDNGYRGLV